MYSVYVAIKDSYGIEHMCKFRRSFKRLISAVSALNRKDKGYILDLSSSMPVRAKGMPVVEAALQQKELGILKRA